ncbi:MAG: hypothetical protein P1V51_10850 [Deltaproteobacteria bacterium]|nr:hypothetical protein [Deltaproteobacteria bacterium]
MLRLGFSLHPDLDRDLGALAGLPSVLLAEETEVLHLEVDGVELLAGHGEERLERLLEELLRLGEILAGGAEAATAHFGPEPVELAIQRGDDEAWLSLLIPGMPPRLLLHHHPVPLADLLGQIAGLARSVAGRLGGGEPALDRLRRRLVTRADHLCRPPAPRRAPRARPPAMELPGAGRWRRSLPGGAELALEVDPVTPPGGALPSVVLGELSLGDWRHRGPLLPFLEGLLEELNAALSTLDDESFPALPLGEATLHPAPQGRASLLAGATLPIGPGRIIAFFLEVYGDYLESCMKASRAAGERPPARLAEADEARRALLYRLGLEEVAGGLPLPAAPPEPPARPGQAPSFGPGDLRHVGLRRQWVREHPLEGTRALLTHHRCLVLAGEGGLALIDARAGDLCRSLPEGRGALPVPGHPDLLIRSGEALERRGAGGALRWRREVGPLAAEPALAGARRLLLLEAGRHLHCLDAGSGETLWRSLSATDPAARRWLRPLGAALLLLDESGAVELFDPHGHGEVRGRLPLRPDRSPLPLPGGGLLVLGRREGGPGALLLRPEGPSGPAAPGLPLPPLRSLEGALPRGGRLLLWGRDGEETSSLWSLRLDGAEARLLLRAPGPLTLEAWRGGWLAVDGRGHAHASGSPGASLPLELGEGPVGLLRFGEIVIATAEHLAVVHRSGSRRLGALELGPAEGPVILRRGPGRSFSLVDGHGCLQRFSVAGHLSVVV